MEGYRAREGAPFFPYGCAVLTVKETAKILGISPSKLYQKVERREISHYRIDGKILFSQEQIQDFLGRCRIDITEAPSMRPPRRPAKLKHVRA
jgi:excisionase family DNA binding protein